MKKLFPKEFIIYCLVGVVNTLVGTSTAVICLNVFLLGYLMSTVLCYITGTIVSFLLNKKYTFKNTDKASMQFVKFFMTMLPSYIFSYWFGFHLAHFSAKFIPEFLNTISTMINMPTDRIVDNLALVISITLHLIIGFSINKLYVFKKNHNN